MRGTLSPVGHADLHQTFEAAVARWAAPANTAMLAVSGGPDSIALLRLCVDARERGAAVPSALHVGHVDHGLRDGAAEDAEFVRDLAAAHGLPFHLTRVDAAAISADRGWNVAAGARRLRYTVLSRFARDVGADAIFTAHTADDQVETVLQQLLRGAAYLSGIPPSHGRVVRPLLEVRRDDLLAYLEEIGQAYAVDPSNTDLARFRPWLRHELLPGIDERAPGAKAAMTRLADVQREARAFLDEEAVRRFGTEPLDVAPLARAPVALQRHAIAALLQRHAAPVEYAVIERIRERLDGTAPYRVDVAAGVTVRIAYGRMEVVTGGPSRVEARPVAGLEDLPPGAPRAVLEEEGPLTLRARRPGDVIRLPGGTKKVSDLLVDRKIPREERDGLPLIARDGEVLWIEGVATAAGIPSEPDPDEAAMERALQAARRGGEVGELPVGAVVVVAGEIVAEAHNETEERGDPTAHAELLALQRAASRLGRHALRDATLVVTLEPCPMCLGALLQAHVGRVVFGADNSRDGALGGVMDLTVAPWKRTLEVRGGVRAPEASELLTGFFRDRR